MSYIVELHNLMLLHKDWANKTWWKYVPSSDVFELEFFKPSKAKSLPRQPSLGIPYFNVWVIFELAIYVCKARLFQVAKIYTNHRHACFASSKESSWLWRTVHRHMCFLAAIIWLYVHTSNTVRAIVLFTTFLKTISLFLRTFFKKILTLRMVTQL